MAIEVKNVILIAISMMVIALILPLALGLLAVAGDTIIVPAILNATESYNVITPAVLLKDVVNPSVLTLLTILIPILAVVGIAITFISIKD